MKTWKIKTVGAAAVLSMLVNSMAVYAEETDTATETQSSSVILTEDMGISDDELLLGYFENKLYGVEGGFSTFAFGNSVNLNENDKKAYDAIVALAKKVAAGEQASTTCEITYTITGTDFDASNWMTYVNNFESSLNLAKALGCAMRDYPYEFYWYDKSEGAAVNFGRSLDSTTQITVTVTLSFTPGKEYKSSGYTVNTAITGEASQAALNAQKIVDDASGGTDYERLKAYKDAICELVSYDHVAAENITVEGYDIDPWQVIHVFDKLSSTNVVCEGYAKAFQYLCDLDGGLTCYSVTGTMSGGTGAGGHMWNIVTLDGKNYLVDVTNSDEDSIGEGEEEPLFLKGMSSGSAYSYSKSIGGSKITFTYDSDTLSYFSSSVLQLSAEDYEIPSSGSYTVSFDLNGFEGTMAPVKAEGSYTLPECEFVDPDGIFHFVAWTYNGTEYPAGSVYNVESDITFVAVYEAHDPYLVENGSVIEVECDCGADLGKIELIAEDSVYNGIPVTVRVEDTNSFFNTSSIEYCCPDGCVNAGTHTASMTVVDDIRGTTATATVTFEIKKADAKVTKAPSALTDLTYNEGEQILISAGDAKSGTMVYSLDGVNYSEDLPVGKDAGTYTVYYKVIGDENYNDTTPKTITVTISDVTQEPDDDRPNTGGEGNIVKPSVTTTEESVVVPEETDRPNTGGQGVVIKPVVTTTAPAETPEETDRPNTGGQGVVIKPVVTTTAPAETPEETDRPNAGGQGGVVVRPAESTTAPAETPEETDRPSAGGQGGVVVRPAESTTAPAETPEETDRPNAGGQGGIIKPSATTTTAAPSAPSAPSVVTTTVTSTDTTVPPAEDDTDEDDDSIDDTKDSTDPQVKGDSDKAGWDAIETEIIDADEGDTIYVEMNGATEIPQHVFDQLKGQDITLVFELDNGFVWTIYGKDVTDPATIDLGVNEGSEIPEDVVDDVAGDCDYITITLDYDGEFGFTATLSVDLGAGNKSQFANLYYFNGDDAEFIDSDKISTKGIAELTFSHASEYIIVVDNEDHGKTAEDVDNIVNTDEEDPNPETSVTIAFTGLVISAAAAVITRRKKK